MSVREQLDRGLLGESQGVVEQMVEYWHGQRPHAPSIDAVSTLGAGALAAAGARAAVITLDGSALRSWISLIETINDDDARVAMPLYQGFAQLFEGNAAAACTSFHQASSDAKATGWSGARVEAAIGLALAHIEQANAEEALTAARRAFRMARSEELPHYEIFASIGLARVRRCCGAAHLAAHILTHVVPLAPKPWHEWVSWEAVFAGQAALPAARVAGLLETCLKACSTGERTTFEEASRAIAEQVESVTPIARDWSAFHSAVDLSRRTSNADEEDFRSAHTSVVPRGIQAINDPNQDVVAYVLTHQDSVARFLQRGLRLCVQESVDVLDAETLPGIRTASAILSLLGNDAHHEATFFHALYGFELEPVHRPVLDTLLHRVRKALGELATLVRQEGTLRLEVHRDFAIWDPRCAAPLEDRLLRLLASQGPRHPDEVAAHLGYSRRSVYDVLRHLVEEGVCRRAREGRRVHYVVEDSVFSAPTQARFKRG